jgi:hypothetical protein
MIDSINFTIPKQINLALIPSYTIKSHGDSEMILYYSGRLGPLSVIVKPNSNTTKISGSIRKFFLGETELSDLTFEQLSKALNKLRLTLHLSHKEFSESVINRIDVGTNIPIERNIHEYFDALVSYPRLEKVTYDDGIEFRGAFKKLIFYNKVVKESRINKSKKLFYHGQEVTADNLLRFEIQYRRVSGLQRQLSGIRIMNQILDQSHFLWDLVLTEFAKVVFSSAGILKPDVEIKDTGV